jgi:phosphatidate cytidylyltransferase
LKNVIQRTVSGIIYLALIIGSLIISKFAFGVAMILISTVALYEFYRMTNGTAFPGFGIIGMISGLLIYTLTFLYFGGYIDMKILVILLAMPAIHFIILLYGRNQDIIKISSLTWLGVLYISVPISMMSYMLFPRSNGFNYTYVLILGLLSLVWINDIGAYVVGTTVGRNRLFPRISPKKSWEGVLGGAVFTLITAWWMHAMTGMLSRINWMVLAIIVSAFGIYGDLTESLFKRNADLKDSGNLVPGHGGILDRIDSILFVMPVSIIYLVLNNL